MEFCRKLSAQEGVEYRLPTEAEWEYACRAGTTTAYCFGDDTSQLGEYAWFFNNSDNTTHPVGEKLPNAWGLFDMHGNVEEWSQDRVLRGGALTNPPRLVRAALRFTERPSDRSRLIGFRVVRTYNFERTPRPKPTKPKTGLRPISATPPLAVAPFDEMQAKAHQKVWARHLDTRVEITNSIGMQLRLIPPGEFMMGSPESEPGRDDDETQHRVRITKPFYLSATEVMQEQYERVMGNNPSDIKGENKPVKMVRWNEAVEFCRKLSAKEGVEYRLPTEAEWEYACRAGTTTAYIFGDDATQFNEFAWHHGNAGRKAHAVGEKLPNAWGLYDMHGNVWEWCQDWYAAYGSERVLIDPTGPVQGSLHVLRGGSFFEQAKDVRSAFRGDLPDGRNGCFGFRVARTFNLSP